MLIKYDFKDDDYFRCFNTLFHKRDRINDKNCAFKLVVSLLWNKFQTLEGGGPGGYSKPAWSYFYYGWALLNP